MWGLDRFSGHSTPRGSPPPGSRDFSPAPRRSLNLAQRPLPARPELSSRTSSLLNSRDGLQNASGAGKAPGSGLRNQIASAPPADIKDPIVALHEVLGITPEASESDENQDVDFGGLSLEEFAGKLRTEAHTAPQPSDSSPSVDQFAQEQAKFEGLHTSITACDDVLKSVEQYLGSFQSDLSTVAAEIESLQSRSTALNGMLDSRRKVESVLGPVVAKVTISPAIVKKISEGPIDEQFVAAVEELKKAIDSTNADSSNGDATFKAREDLKPLLDDLSKKAVERSRDYFAARIKTIRAPNMNAQFIQQQDFLKQKGSFAFLASQQPQLAQDLTNAYTNTMRWYYLSHFTRYHAALSKLKIHAVDRHDLIGEDLSARSQTSSGKLPGHDAFNLGRRIEILRESDANALPASTAEESKIPTYVETPFASFNLAILDNASFEYTFLSTFLPSESPLANPRAVSAQFRAIFAPTLELANSLSKSLIAESFDALGVLLAVRINQHFAFVAQKRKIPTMESYINGMSMLLWPRFQLIMDAHCESLKKLTSALPSRTGSGGGGAAGAALASLSGNSTSGPSTAPHPVTQRFASLLQGILTLSSEAGDDEPVSNSLARLRNDFDSFLNKIAAAFTAGDKGKRERERFLSNNYSLVLTIVADASGRLADECKEHFESLRGVAR